MDIWRFFFCAFIIGPGRVALPLFLVLCIPMTTVSVLQAALEQDEMVLLDDIMLTYPLTKKEIVLARFIDNMIYVGINAVISVLMMLVYVYGAKTTDLQTGLLYCALGLVVSLVTTAVFSVGFYILGNKKGTILYIALVLVATISYCFTQLNFSFAWILNMNPLDAVCNRACDWDIVHAGKLLGMCENIHKTSLLINSY